MFSFFWRIFLGFWFSLLLLGFAGNWLSESLRNSDKALALNPAQYLFLKKFRKKINNKNIRRLLKHWQQLPPKKPLKRILVIDSEGETLTATKIPKAVELLLQQSNNKPMLLRNWNELWIGPLTIQNGNEKFRVFLNTENAPYLNARTWLEHPVSRLLLLLLASLVAAFLVSFFLVRPIKKLQITVNSLKSDLSYRVDEKLTNRKDELGKLGKQINSMAETIQKLVNSQQNILWDVSHELRSPLARIKTALAIAEQKSEPEKAIFRLNKEVDLLNKMITQLLLLGRLEAGLQKIQHEPVHLKSLIQQIIDDMHYESKTKFNAQIKIEDELQVLGDPLLLASLFGNLLRNAREHNQQQITLNIEASCEQQFCEIIIQDDGTGISRIMQQQLFTPFKRDNGNVQGLGLGMAISRNIVELHCGEISAHNIPGGFKIIIRLPQPIES